MNQTLICEKCYEHKHKINALLHNLSRLVVPHTLVDLKYKFWQINHNQRYKNKNYQSVVLLLALLAVLSTTNLTAKWVSAELLV